MTIDAVVFDTKIGFGTVGGASAHKTEIITSKAGFEQRNIDWSKSRGRWNILKPITSSADLEYVIGFHMARRGRAYGFLFKDRADYSVSSGTLIASAEGGETTAQLQKIYTSGARTFTRTIYKPTSGTVTVYRNGVALGGASVSTTTGLVTLGVTLSAADVVTADFEFYVPVRFDIDELDIVHDTHGKDSIQNLPIVELRVRSDGSG